VEEDVILPLGLKKERYGVSKRGTRSTACFSFSFVSVYIDVYNIS
jgi:hypothetical protein